MITVVDIGEMFGYPCAQILKPQETVLKQYDDTKSIATNLEGVDLVIFGGGQDVNPLVYHHKNVASYCGGSSTEISGRDRFESEIFDYVFRYAIHRVKLLGICRGAQFLCAKTGGWLVQHVDGHGGQDHMIETPYGRILVNSYHHQMMVPSEFSGIVGYSEPMPEAKYVYDVESSHFGRGLDTSKNAEIVNFDEGIVGIQSHPEYFGLSHPNSKLARRIIRDYLRLEVTE